MIDLSNLANYQENNRIEAKLALGGLPESIWETYSAFANSFGGIILLGVAEEPDKSFRAVDLPDPAWLVAEFWEKMHTPGRVSVNILTERDVTIETVDGKHIIVITVPRARRHDKPVYLDGDPMSGSYRRGGEGDYRCTREEVQAMFRDAAARTADLVVLESLPMTALCEGTLSRYRAAMRTNRAGHPWEKLTASQFLQKLGAAAPGSDGRLHPTAAGLLMFGRLPEIRAEFPHYRLEYRERTDAGERVILASEETSDCCNLCDFFFTVYARLAEEILLPFVTEHPEESPIHHALRETLANALIHADYYGAAGLCVTRTADGLILTNPGGMRVDKKSGTSDPRNAVLLRMFNLMNVGESASERRHGIPYLYAVWQEQGWQKPLISERLSPDRTTVRLKFGGDWKAQLPELRQHILTFLTERIRANVKTIAAQLPCDAATLADLLQQLEREEIITRDDQGLYQLKK